jgi:ArsR family transcriptional regulator
VAVFTPNRSPGDNPFAPPACTKQNIAPWRFVLSVLTLLRWLSILIAIEIRRLGAANMTQEQFHQVAKALADPQRFAILERIAGERGELACKALVQEFSISQATISHHLKELSEAGLIDCRREAQCAFLSLRRHAMEAYREELGRRMALDRRPIN